MSHLLLFLTEEATRQAWSTAEARPSPRSGIVIVLTVLEPA